jgi:hypothetical protein
MAIMGPDCRHGDWKNEKDRPPMHSGGQSLQTILLNETKFNSSI